MHIKLKQFFSIPIIMLLVLIIEKGIKYSFFIQVLHI